MNKEKGREKPAGVSQDQKPKTAKTPPRLGQV